jgi:hypothetical protein
MKALLSIGLLLLSCGQALSADASPPVFLSHVWIALDEATYDALKTSQDIAALGAAKEKKTVAGNDHWSGFYWSGRQTYLEFFGAAALPDETLVGDCGIGLSVETRGGVAAVAERLRTAFGDKIEIDKQVKSTAAGDIPWYTFTYANLKELQKTAVWVMELDPGYLPAIHPEAPVPHALSRRQDRSWDYRSNQTLDNIVGLTLALDKVKISEVATQLKLFGWSIRSNDSDIIATGPDVQIRIVPAGNREGIKQVDLRLSRSVSKQSIQLGNSQLRLVGKSAQLVLWK